jgi:hypothetical protein
LLPAALYKFMKEPSLKNPNPVRLLPGVAVASSHEVRQNFLCTECEIPSTRAEKGGPCTTVPSLTGRFPSIIL